MCRIASLLLLQRLKGSMSGDASDFNNIETRAVIKFFLPARKGAEGNSRHSERNIRGICTMVCYRQNWVAHFKRGDFSTCDAPHPWRLKTVTTPEIIDQIHELILEDRRISAKSIANWSDWRVKTCNGWVKSFIEKVNWLKLIKGDIFTTRLSLDKKLG